MKARLSALVVPLALAFASLGGAAAASTAPILAVHQTPLVLDSAATAWVLTATALVLMMTLPGLALFYGGMVRRKNILATVAQSAMALVVVTVLWFVAGYSLAFGTGPGPLHSLIGSLDAAFLEGVTPQTAHQGAPGLPEFGWIAYQLTFAIIAPAIIAGAFAERMKVSAALLFFGLWHLLVYAPICHLVWGGGWLERLGVLDFAGGSVIHVSAGVSGLVCALVLGPRYGFGRDNMAPSNLALTAAGTGLLMVGWIGLNAGSAGAADGIAALAALNTILAAAAAALAWLVAEWIRYRRPTLLGLLSGLVCGLVAVTPAAGFVEPKGAFAIGLIAGPVCFFGSTWLKHRLRYDDSLDAWGIHGLGGIVGALLTGVFASVAINGGVESASVLKQAIGLLVVAGWSGLGAYLILMICRYTTGLRVEREHEIEGLDYSQHGETLHS